MWHSVLSDARTYLHLYRPNHCASQKIRDKLPYLSWRALTSASVRADLLIHQACTRYKEEILQGSNKDNETRGDVVVQGLWDLQIDAIIVAKFWNADADTYKYGPMTALLARWEMINKDKHGNYCHCQRKHLSKFVISVEGMLGRESIVVLLQLSWVMSEKTKEPLLQVRGWLNGQIVLCQMNVFQSE